MMVLLGLSLVSKVFPDSTWKTQNALHARNEATLVVSQIVQGFLVRINWIWKVSPVSGRGGVLLFIKSTIPPTTRPDTFFFNFHPQLKVVTNSSRGMLHDGKRNSVLTVWAVGVVRRIWCVVFHGTGGVTRFITAPQRGRIVDL